MKPTIKVFSLSSDDEDGTNTSLFAFEEKAVDALLDKLEISTTVQTEFKEYTRAEAGTVYVLFKIDLLYNGAMITAEEEEEEDEEEDAYTELELVEDEDEEDSTRPKKTDEKEGGEDWSK